MENEKKGLSRYFGVFAKGIGMGAADVVPGVSGGTIAFISGIYQELLDTIKGVNIKNLKTIKTEGLAGFWKNINGNFIVALFAGIATSILSLASLISGVLEVQGPTNAKVSLWSFFFGLIVASVIYIAKQVKGWTFKEVIGLLVGGAVAYYVTIANVSEDSDSLLFLFFAGALAISAMILPGISGSFILVLLGAYQPVMTAIKNAVAAVKLADVGAIFTASIPLAVVGLGCIIGLLSFSRVLSWLFKNQENITLATLTGFMIGSLNKIWPWKKTLATRLNSEGLTVPTVTGNISPEAYETINTMDSNLSGAVMFAVIGFVIVFALEFVGNKFKNEQ